MSIRTSLPNVVTTSALMSYMTGEVDNILHRLTSFEN